MVKFSRDLLTLKQFLGLPEFKPAFEYLGGRVVQKMSPLLSHSVIQVQLTTRLNDFARPRKHGFAYTELRCTFGGQSLVFDISYFERDRVPKMVRGQEAPAVLLAPDIAIEILSPGQTVAELRAKLRHSLRHGSRLGWLIRSTREEVQVYRPRRKAEILRPGQLLTGEDVLPGFALPIEEMFAWLEAH